MFNCEKKHRMNKEYSRTKRFLYSSVTTAFYQLSLFAAGMITPKIMLVFYSSEINGLVTSISQFITYFNLIEAGLSGAAVYALYKPLADKDSSAVSSVVVATKKFYDQIGTVFLLLISVFSIAYPFIISVDSLPALQVGILVIILGGNSVLEFFSLAKYRALLAADQKTYIISLASIIQVILNTIIICVLAQCGVNILVLRLVALASVFVRTAILAVYVRKKYPQVNYKAEPNSAALNKRWDAMYMQILGAIHSGAPVLILTLVVKDLLLVSVFSIYNMVVTGLHGIMTIFSSGISASFGDVIVKKQNSILQDTYQQFELAYLSLMTVIYATAMVMIQSFVKIYTHGITDANYNLPMVGILIVLNAFVFNIKSPQAMLLIAAGLYKESRLQTTIQGAIMVVLGCVFGYFWGIEGILAASIISNVYRDIDLIQFIPKHVTHLPVKNTLLRWIRSIVCFILIYVIFNFVVISPNGYLQWIIWAFIVVAVSSVILLLNALCFDRTILTRIVCRIKETFKK